jgi:hypothetical protein
MMRKSLAAAALSLGLAFGIAAPAHAAGTASCSSGMYVKAKTNVKIRKYATTNSTALGLFLSGAKACNVAQGVGQKLTVCGGTSDVWQKIRYGSTTGWIPRTCAIYL